MNRHKNISNLSLAISTHIHELSAMEKEMVQQIMKNRSLFTYKSFTIANIAEQLNVSSTSLHRVSKKLGYESFTLFKEDYFAKQEMDQQEENEHHDYLDMLSTTYRLVKRGISNEMIEQLASARRITIYGMGMSSYLAKMFQIKLQLAGILCEQYDDSRYMRISSQNLRPQEDMIIILSRSGRPPELVETITAANALKVPSILITEQESSPLSGMATYVLYTAYTSDSDQSLDTRVTTHIAMDVLIRSLLKEKKKANEK